MRYLVGLICIAISTGAAGSVAAEDTPTKVPPPMSICETDPHFSDFDFWVGGWRVTARKSGEFAGENSITKEEGGCFLQEKWTSAGGGTGQSMNYYNPATGKWRQIWIAQPGYIIDYEGGLQDGAMVLVGTITSYADNIPHPFRGTWTPNDDGTVRQFFEQYSEDEKVWKTWFDGVYIRKG